MKHEILKLSCQKQKGDTVVFPDTLSLNAEKGIEEDYHTDTEKQITLIFESTLKAIENMQNNRICTNRFHGNIILSGEIPEGISKGGLLSGDECVIEITKVGRKCHGLCDTGDCPLIKEILFARVIKGGKIKVGEKLVYAG